MKERLSSSAGISPARLPSLGILILVIETEFLTSEYMGQVVAVTMGDTFLWRVTACPTLLQGIQYWCCAGLISRKVWVRFPPLLIVKPGRLNPLFRG